MNEHVSQDRLFDWPVVSYQGKPCCIKASPVVSRQRQFVIVVVLYNLQVSDSVTVTVTSSLEAGPFTYVVISRGAVVDEGYGALVGGTATLSLTVGQNYTPKAAILVYAVVGGELLADSISFNVNGVFENSVSI